MFSLYNGDLAVVRRLFKSQCNFTILQSEFKKKKKKKKAGLTELGLGLRSWVGLG